jgi:putative phage-type endonuclease
MQPLIANVEQGSVEWLQARLGKATASRFNDIMAKGRNGNELAGYKNYRAELVTERLTESMAEFYKNSAMEWGTDTEPLARLRYELRTGNEVEECGFYTHASIEAGASPDGLIGDDGLLEIKCPNTATHIETLRKQVVPKQYYWQVMGQMWITGRKWCDFVSFDPRLTDNACYFQTRLDRDEEAIKLLETEVRKFLETVDQEVTFIKNYNQ